MCGWGIHKEGVDRSILFFRPENRLEHWSIIYYARLAQPSELCLTDLNSTKTKDYSLYIYIYPWALCTVLASSTVLGSGTILVLGSGTVPGFYTSCSSRAGSVPRFLGTVLVPICTNLTYPNLSNTYLSHLHNKTLYNMIYSTVAILLTKVHKQ